MISWITVVVACSIGGLIYFLVKGIKMALFAKELPEPSEGDYEIAVVGKFRDGRLLAVMSPKKEKDA